MLTVEDIFKAAERDLGSAAFRQMGAGLFAHQWVMSAATFAEAYAAVRLDGQPVEPPDVDGSVLLGLPIRIDDDEEGLRVERRTLD
jgi:hypothetical protein